MIFVIVKTQNIFKTKIMEKIKVYYVANRSAWGTEVKSLNFSSKENADTFIALMKAEGYEITQFGGEGYIG